MNAHNPEQLRQVLTWIGVANQLTTTRLNHFSHNPEKKSIITQLTSAFQANQPAITKTVQHLVKKGYLEIQVSEKDKRVKYHSITAAGIKAHREAIARILPDAQFIFADWSPEEINTFHQSLFRLKNWLDDHRDTVVNN